MKIMSCAEQTKFCLFGIEEYFFPFIYSEYKGYSSDKKNEYDLFVRIFHISKK